MPASARVSAYFYLGRTEVSSGHILQGLQLLERAFAECPPDSSNMQTILRFLVPVSTSTLNSKQLLAYVTWSAGCKV
jgi:hypothetical protein